MKSVASAVILHNIVHTEIAIAYPFLSFLLQNHGLADTPGYETSPTRHTYDQGLSHPRLVLPTAILADTHIVQGGVAATCIIIHATYNSLRTLHPAQIV